MTSAARGGGRELVAGLLATVAGAAIVSSIAFGPHLDGEFVWDDVYQVQNNATLIQGDGYRKILTTDLWGGADSASTQLYHPVPMLSMWLQAQVSGVSMVPFRLGNMAIHLCCCLLLYGLFIRTDIPPLLAACISVLFAAHPSVTEAVMWLTGRHDTLGVACSLGALILWPRPDPCSLPSRAARVCLSSLLCALALLCKEPYVVVPFMLAVREVIQPAAPHHMPITRRLPWLLLPAASLGGVFYVRHVLGISSSSDALFFSPLKHLENFATIFSHYAAQIVTLSNGRTIQDYQVLPAWLSALVCFGVGAALVCLIVSWRRGSRVAGQLLVGVVWFCLALSPHLLSITAIDMFANRYAYFPLCMASLILAVGCRHISSRLSGRRRLVLIVGLLVMSLAVSLETSVEASAWKDDLTLYGADLKTSPEDPKVLYHFGHALRRKAGCPRALRFFQESARMDPGYWRAWHNVTGCLINMRRFKDATQAGTRAAKLRPNNHRTLYNLGVALVYSGRREQGVAYLRRALKIAPTYAPARELLSRLER